MTEREDQQNYVTSEQLSGELEGYVGKGQLEERLNKFPGFWNGAGRALYSVAENVLAPVAVVGVVATVVGAVGWGFASCCSYGPFDATRVGYHEAFGNSKQAKHEDVQYAESRYARLLRKDTLEPADIQNLYFEMGAPKVKGQTTTENDLAWKRVLDWIEDNPAPQVQ